jgi:hypothetical protein
VPPTPTPVATAVLTGAPVALNFGRVDATGTSVARRVTLTNRSTTTTATISTVTADAPFAVVAGTDTCSGESIAPRRNCSVNIAFMPATVAAVTDGSIDVTYNGSNPAVRLEGNGIAIAVSAPPSRLLTPVASPNIGNPSTIVVFNPNTVAVTFGTAVLGGIDPASFRISSNQCSATILAAKARCSIGIQFAPIVGATGMQRATLSMGFTYGANDGTVTTALAARAR